MQILYNYYDYLSNYSKSTQNTYYENVKLFIRYLQETKGKSDIIHICNIEQSDIYNYIAYMDHLSKNTKAIRLNSIKNFYSYLKIRQDYFEDIKLFNLNKKMPCCLSSSQLERLFNYYSGKRNKLIIYLFISTGIRLSELANIKIEDINLEEKYIKIMCKGGKERNVLINEKCKRMIKDYMNTEGNLFNIKKRQIQNIVSSALKNLNLKGSTHTLRHSSASIIYQNTKDILLVKEFLGHSSVVSTQVYAHLNNNEVKRAVENHPLANFKV